MGYEEACGGRLVGLDVVSRYAGAAAFGNAHPLGAEQRAGHAIQVDQGDVVRRLRRDQIMEAVRGRELEAFDRSIDVHMGRIRAAIEDDVKAPKRILTVRGVGYVFARQQD